MDNDPIMEGAEDHILVAKRSEMVNPIAFGRVLGRLDAQADDIQELKNGLRDNSHKLDRLLEFQAKQKGAATVLTMLASAVAAFIGWASSFFFKG
jgi:hypothetical protein